MLKLVFWLLVAAAIAAPALAKFRYPGLDIREAIYLMVFGPPQTGIIDFTSLKRRATPNDALACPDGLCRNATPDIITQPYRQPTAELITRLETALTASGDSWILLTETTLSPQVTQRVYRLATPLMRFPDVLHVQLENITSGTALALYSASQIGYGDGGKNRARINAVLAALSQ